MEAVRQRALQRRLRGAARADREGVGRDGVACVGVRAARLLVEAEDCAPCPGERLGGTQALVKAEEAGSTHQLQLQQCCKCMVVQGCMYAVNPAVGVCGTGMSHWLRCRW